jgi:transcriptional regulator with PAS, ATPase and Fis domain
VFESSIGRADARRVGDVAPAVPSLIGCSRAIQEVLTEVDLAARCDAKVLILGESGVGKDVVARMIHHRSARAHLPLVAINCLGIPETLLESELFGHVRGSFTGAHRDSVGLLEAAHRGTVFLDEIGDMGARMQALLLRFLETGEIQRVGGTSRLQGRVDVRVIAASNREPLADVATGKFRGDLYYRLKVVDIVVPPLRARREDIHLLCAHFLASFSRQHGVALPEISPRAMKLLVEYDWPGNVRELRNVAERLVVRRCGATVDVADLLAIIPDSRPATPVAEVQPPAARLAHDVGDTATSIAMFERMVTHGESFWSAVYQPFMARDLTRSDLRDLIARGLKESAGNYRILVELFNMNPADYKRFLNFLKKQDCQVPFASFRATARGPRKFPSAMVPPAAGGSATQLRH